MMNAYMHMDNLGIKQYTGHNVSEVRMEDDNEREENGICRESKSEQQKLFSKGFV